MTWRLVRVLLAVLAAAACAAWALQHNRLPAVWAFPIAASVGALVWLRTCPTTAHLIFDGQGWFVEEVSGRPELMIDLNRAVLVRWFPAGGGAPVWMACTAGEAGPAWHGLRVALRALPRQSPQDALSRPAAAE